MKPEAGKFYRTRNGHKAGPIRYVKRAFPFEGLVNGSLESWSEAGSYRIGVSDHPLDLVAAWTIHDDANAKFDAEKNDSIDAPMEMYDVMLDADELTTAATEPARTIYLSGPMKGYPRSNYPLFNAVAARLRRAGHRVYNPAEFGKDQPFAGFPIRQAFAEYSKFICEEADAIVLLPGWEASKGANAERALADNCGLQIIPFEELSITV